MFSLSERKARRAHIVRTGKEPIAGARIRATAAVMRQQNRHEVPSDVNGSYTGTAIDYEVPEQDPDDL